MTVVDSRSDQRGTDRLGQGHGQPLGSLVIAELIVLERDLAPLEDQHARTAITRNVVEQIVLIPPRADTQIDQRRTGVGKRTRPLSSANDASGEKGLSVAEGLNLNARQQLAFIGLANEARFRPRFVLETLFAQCPLQHPWAGTELALPTPRSCIPGTTGPAVANDVRRGELRSPQMHAVRNSH